MRKLDLTFGALLAVSGATLNSQSPLVAREEAMALSNGFVTVSLDVYANDFKEHPFPSRRISAGEVPFDLVAKTGVNHLFLKSAGWSDWEKDPSKYNAEYDFLPMVPSPGRPIVQVPVADYAAVWLLAAADPDPGLAPLVSFRIGAIRGRQRVVYHDFSATVPRIGEKKGVGVVATFPSKDGALFLLRIPLGKAVAQDFKDQAVLDVDVTKELRLVIRRPDPCRYQIRPLGLPSGVRIYGMTFERSPVQMEVTSDESGHVFNEPQVPTFHVTLRNPSEAVVNCSLVGTATAHDGSVVSNSVSAVRLNPGRSTRVDLALTPSRRGYHDLSIELRIGKAVVLRRETAFALLPPDTRRFRQDSPFGTYDFCGQHYTPDDPDVVGPLYVKAGLRYGMFSFPAAAQRKYGVLPGNAPRVKPGIADIPGYVAEEAARLKADSTLSPPNCWMVFHETVISGPNVTRTPDAFTGKGPYVFDEAETKKFREMWQVAEQGAKAIRKEFPKSEIYFGNGPVTVLEEFLRYQFPKELLGSRGNEAGSFMRPPEAQPLDPVANNSSLWMDRQVLDHYGYRDTPLRQCHEICYPSSNPGNLSMRTQAAYLVRHLMHSLAWGIPIIRPLGIIDVGNSYYFSNWGATGLFRAMPDIRPKPVYVAFATTTLLLDGARFTRMVPTGSPVVYAAEFRNREGGHVTCLWTLRGRRDLALTLRGGDPVKLLDLMANETPLAVKGDKATLKVSAEPCFLVSGAAVSQIAPGPAEMEGRPQGRRFLVSSLAAREDWEIEREPNRELELYNFLCPRRKGDFAYREVDTFEGEAKALEVKPKLPVPGPVYLPMYSVLAHRKGVEIAGQPTEIGLMVNGNGGWGRVIFELEDASGQRWISIGAEQKGEPTRWMADWMTPEEFEKLKTAKSSNRNDWNTDDPWGRSAINFEGWRYVRFPLPGNYPGEGYHWPYSSQWRCSGNGVVKYPLKFKKLIITLPEKILYVKDYQPVARQEVYLKDLMVTYEPPEKAFVAE